MRKILYATTALTTAGLLAFGAGEAAAQTSRVETPPPPAPATTSASAERIKLGLSGYYQQWAVITDQSYRTRTSPDASSRHQQTRLVDNKHNAEICVIGQTTLDTGLTIGVNVQIEAFTEADTIDESYLFIQSPTFGQLIVGDENNAGYLLHVTGPDGGVSLDSGDLCNIRAFETGAGSLFDSPLCTTNLRLRDNDSGKFTYITPRFAGFQAGVSYIPNFEAGGDNNSALQAVGTGDGGRNAGIGNGWAGGLNYTEKFGEFGVQASGGVMWAQGFSGAEDLSNSNVLGYNVGAQFSFAGFSLGGAAMWAEGQATATTRVNGVSWTASGAYEFGPYKVGLGYMYGENNRTTGGGKDRLEQATLSGTYTLGPGIRLVGGVFYYDYNEENQLAQNDGIGVTSGIKIGF
jgi:outer membrane protein OmpU